MKIGSRGLKDTAEFRAWFRKEWARIRRLYLHPPIRGGNYEYTPWQWRVR